MRRSIVTYTSLLVAVVSMSGLATPGSAQATARSPRVICPQISPVEPCCPIPVNGVRRGSDAQTVCCATACCPATSSCCPTSTTNACCMAAQCPSGLTITASPDPSTAGQKVVISGSLVGGAAAGATVVLWQEVSGQSSFHRMTQTTANSAGQYTIALGRGAVLRDRKWYVTSQGMQSPTLDQHVAAVVGLSASRTTVAAGVLVDLRGSVSPSHAGQVVLIEQRVAGAWHVIARPRLSHASRYQAGRRFTRAGKIALRAVLGGDAVNDRSVSRTITVDVT